jgi:hypothetical protein
MILERCGYRFERIRGTEFFRDPEKAMLAVLNRLAQLRIQPAVTEPVGERDGQELARRIIERATEIREAWKTEPDLGLGVRKGRGAGRGWGRRSVKSDADPDKRGKSEEKAATAEPSASMSRVVFPRPARGAEDAGRSGSTDLFSLVQSSSDEDKIAGHNVTPRGANGETLVARLSRESLRVIDNRGKGGALWVVGDYSLTSFFEKLKTEGIKFVYAEDGGRATDFKPGWFTKSDA